MEVFLNSYKLSTKICYKDLERSYQESTEKGGGIAKGLRWSMCKGLRWSMCKAISTGISFCFAAHVLGLVFWRFLTSFYEVSLLDPYTESENVRIVISDNNPHLISDSLHLLLLLPPLLFLQKITQFYTIRQ